MLTIYRIALVIAIIGAINWLLIGLFQYDFVAALFMGPNSAGSRTVFTLVGLAGITLIYYLFARDAVHRDAE